MDLLHAMKVFTRVVDMNSFSRAADTLNMPRGSVTTLVQNLEGHLKARLLQRTTRRLSLTADGAAYYERCVRILADIQETENSLTHSERNPQGKLRIDVPTGLGRLVLMPRLDEFQERYPDIELMVGFGDKPIDLIQDGVDCVIRIGTLQDSSLVARRIGIFQRVTVASPSYLARYGIPETLDGLHSHFAVNYFFGHTGRIMDLTFVDRANTVELKMPGKIAVNDVEAYVASGLKGAGLIQAPRIMALPYLHTGELVEVLSQWKPLPLPISAIYPHNRHLLPTVRVFVDWVAELFANCPLFSGQEDAEMRCLPTTGADSSDRGAISVTSQTVAVAI